MAKLNVTAAYAAYQEELALTTQLAKKEVLMQHPYYGISDARGYLTRYPIESQDEEKGALKLSAEWLRAFTQAGGQCDSNSWGGHYGVCPYRSTWAEQLDPIQFGRYVALSGRADGNFGQTYWELRDSDGDYIMQFSFRDDVSYFLSQFIISETCDTKTLARAWRGALIRRIFQENNISHSTKSLLTLGHWSQQKVDGIVLSQAAPTSGEMLRKWTMQLTDLNTSSVLSPTLERQYKCAQKYIARTEYLNHEYEARVKAENKKREVQSASAYLLIQKFEGNKRLSNSWLRLPERSITSVGQIREFRDGSLSLYTLDSRENPMRCMEVKFRTNFGYRHFSAINGRGNTIHIAWLPSEGFERHMESNISVADAMEKLKFRNGRKPSDGISLNHVRNDMRGTAGYCLAGTKQFLQARMPFLYQLIKKYQEWAEVPADIMATKYYPHSTSLFQGFRNPLINEGGE